jgi:hypothetical protein
MLKAGGKILITQASSGFSAAEVRAYIDRKDQVRP